MSFPTIPDIKPYINITTEEAIKLLITSITQQEASLNKLIETENYDILRVLSKRRYEDSLVKDILDINESVDMTIQHIGNLQMILQNTIEKSRELFLLAKKTFPKQDCTVYEEVVEKCSYLCKVNGIILNSCDSFFKHSAALQIYIPHSDITSRSITYSTKADDINYCLRASAHNIKTEEQIFCDRMTFYGTGYVNIKSKVHACTGEPVKFSVTVWSKTLETVEFRMEIRSETSPELNHDSGFVKAQ